MAAKMLRGALVEYSGDFLGPLPNVVLFQFNPESLTRSIQPPPRNTSATTRENTQAGEPPVERVTVNAVFSAADGLNVNNPLARGFGVGPQLAALEKMVYPAGKLSNLIGQAVDAIGDAIFGGNSDDAPTQPIPRESQPRILFIWGLTRIVPVLIESMVITEQQYDFLLNPVEAQVAIGLAVVPPPQDSDDKVGKGALEYTQIARDAQAMLNLANTAQLAVDLIPF
jgi:hypothetical protein